ncbi:MAG: hypothetical protein KDJ77_03335 [Rhodobiaceae bacterium]|nr:hypothetical protein [Rhodobiaceae bacterium]
MAYRDSASFGKRQEYIAVAELLRRGFDVYMTLVDDQQIDCVIRLDEIPPRYLDIQIKARSNTAKYPGLFAALEIRAPRRGFFFIFFSEPADTYWVIPSLDVVRKTNIGKSGRAKGKYHLNLATRRRDGSVVPRPKWSEYENAFALLTGMATP